MVFCRSFYSFGYGVESPSTLAGAAAEAGLSALVVADQGGLYGAVDTEDSCRGCGISPGLGASLRIGGRSFLFVSLAGGWPAMCRLVTASGGENGCGIAASLVDASCTAAVAFDAADAAWLTSSGYAGRAYLAVLPSSPSGIPPGEAQDRALAAGLSPIAFPPVVFATAGGPARHRMLRAGSLHCAMSALPPGSLAHPSSRMPGPGALERSFPCAHKALEENESLASRVACLPGPVPPSSNPGADLLELETKVIPRLRETYGRAAAAAARVRAELDAIGGAGLAGYFLEFAEIVDFCRERGITATARGSAAGSILAYLLGISAVCPMRHALSFARFFNTLRPDPPDIDLDIDSERRDEVMDHVLDSRAGRAGFVGAMVCHRRRSAFRVAAEAWGLSPSDIDSLSRGLSDPSSGAWSREPAASIRKAATLLEGVPSHLAPHPCGLVVSPGRLSDTAPSEPGTTGRPVVQLDGDGVERLGLLKMDLLGQRGLSVISRVAAATAAVPLGGADECVTEALELMDRADTLGVVHVESPAMRGLLREMTIRSLDDVARALALVRPGASGGGGRDRYLSAIRGTAPASYALPALRECLRDSFGVLLYEEDVSESASRLLGLDEARADLLRRRLKRKSVSAEEMGGMCTAAGLCGEEVTKASEFLRGFEGYGFCRSHAYAYAFVACRSAGLKASSPAVFMAAVLAGGGGFYDQTVYIEEARRMGLRMVAPGVNGGDWAAREHGGAVMLGFSSLRGMGTAEFEKLRSRRPHASPSSVAAPGCCGRAVAEAMALAGCFDELGMTRSQALWAARCPDAGLLPGADFLPSLPEHSTEEKVVEEIRLLGSALSADPSSLVERPRGTTPMSSVGTSPCRIWGRVLTSRRLDGGCGFLMLGDGTGYADLFVPSGMFRPAMVSCRRPGATLVAAVVPEPGHRLRATSVCAGPLTPFPAEL